MNNAMKNVSESTTQLNDPSIVKIVNIRGQVYAYSAN